MDYHYGKVLEVKLPSIIHNLKKNFEIFQTSKKTQWHTGLSPKLLDLLKLI